MKNLINKYKKELKEVKDLNVKLNLLKFEAKNKMN